MLTNLQMVEILEEVRYNTPQYANDIEMVITELFRRTGESISDNRRANYIKGKTN